MHPHTLQVLSLFRSILHLHRLVLPIDARLVGDAFVKEEFKNHKSANKTQAQKFLAQWLSYKNTLDTVPKPEKSHSESFLDSIGMSAVASNLATDSQWPNIDFENESLVEAPEHPLAPSSLDKLAYTKGFVDPNDPELSPADRAELESYERLRSIAQNIVPERLNQEQKEKLDQLRDQLFKMELDPDLAPEEALPEPHTPQDSNFDVPEDDLQSQLKKLNSEEF